MTSYSISVYLDKRRLKQNGKYPLKLGIFTSNPRKRKLYPTQLEYSENEFKNIWETVKPKSKPLKDERQKIEAIKAKADEVAKSINPFTFDRFEKLLYRKPNAGINLEYLFDEKIKSLDKKNQISTSEIYSLSRKSIENYLKEKKKPKISSLTLYDIDADWLNDFEFFMINDLERSYTTVSIYTRCIRTLFNTAISEKDIEDEFYPFGKGKYEVPNAKAKKRAFDKKQIKKLYNLNPETPEQEKAKDFWFLSYSCNGINIKDLLLLKNEQIKNGKFEFIRAKTKLTKKQEIEPITVYLNGYIKQMVKKYGNSDKSPQAFVFNVLTDKMSPIEKHKRIKNFTRFINQNIKKLCKKNGLPEEISTYWARHTFATLSVRKGASMEFMQESLGHSDIKTTQIYMSGFDKKTKKKFAKDLMNF